MRKGQYYVIEQTILIGAGLVIALGFVLAFDAMRADIQERTLDTQAQLISRLIASTGVELVEGGVDGEYRITLPPTLSGERYLVELSNGEVVTTSSGVSHRSGLYGLAGRVSVDGSMASDAGGIIVSFSDRTLRALPQ